ncbi:hypothetical protein R5P03_08745 [Oenococcus oeni]
MTAISNKIGINAGLGGSYYVPDKGWYRYTDDEAKQQFDYDYPFIKNSPFKFVRLIISYRSCLTNTTTPAGSNDTGVLPYDWESWDYAINQLLADDFTVIIAPDTWDTVTYDLSGFKDWLTALIKHYSNKGIIWEGINEATSGNGYWFNQPVTDQILKDIVDTNKYLYNLVRVYDPKSKFSSGAFPSSTNENLGFAETAIQLGILDQGDYASYHPYEYGAPEQILTNSWDVQTLNDFKNKNLLPIASEFGYATPSQFNGNYTEDEQSDNVLREYLLLDSLGYEVMALFDLQAVNPFSIVHNPSISDFNLKVDLSTSAVKMRAYNDIQKFFTNLYGYSFVTRESTDSNSDYIFRYAKSGQLDKIVFWTSGSDHQIKYKNETLSLTSSPSILTDTKGTRFNVNNYSDIQLGLIQLSDNVSNSLITNFQNNQQIILNSIENINNFLQTMGISIQLDSNQILDLTGYSEMNYEFVNTYWSNFQVLTNLIQQLISIFNSISWLNPDDGSKFSFISAPDYQISLDGELTFRVNNFWNSAQEAVNAMNNKIQEIVS